jgi:hypothetical protein
MSEPLRQLEGEEEESEGREEGHEISPLEYARLNGLSFNHFKACLAAEDLQNLRIDVITDNLGSDIPSFNFDLGLRLEERLTISKGAAILLSTISRECPILEIDAMIISMVEKFGPRNLRLELPLLQSDHDADCRKFGAREGFDIKLQDIKLPLETVHEDNKDGLTWPARYSNLGEEIKENLRLEKLQVSKDVANLFQTVIGVKWTEEDEIKLWDSEQQYRRVSESPQSYAYLLNTT